MNRNFHSVHLEIILPLNILIYSAALSALFRGQLHAYKLGKDETKHRRRPAMQDIYFGFSGTKVLLTNYKLRSSIWGERSWAHNTTFRFHNGQIMLWTQNEFQNCNCLAHCRVIVGTSVFKTTEYTSIKSISLCALSPKWQRDYICQLFD